MRGRVRMGNTCTTMADSCEYMAKPPQYCKVISLQLKLKKKKKTWRYKIVGFELGTISSLVLITQKAQSLIIPTAETEDISKV